MTTIAPRIGRGFLPKPPPKPHSSKKVVSGPRLLEGDDGVPGTRTTLLARGGSETTYKKTTSPQTKPRDCWRTAKEWALALGPWDLDPCSNPLSHVVATRTFMLERGQDGLELARKITPETRTFLNPPFSRGQVDRWWAAYRHVRWCFLLRWDPRTEWFEVLYDASTLIAAPPKINFEPPPGIKASSNMYPHAFFYADERDATDAIKRQCFTWRKKRTT